MANSTRIKVMSVRIRATAYDGNARQTTARIDDATTMRDGSGRMPAPHKTGPMGGAMMGGGEATINVISKIITLIYYGDYFLMSPLK